MSNDIVIELWLPGGHWFLKKSGNQDSNHFHQTLIRTVTLE